MADSPPTSTTFGIAGESDPPIFSPAQTDMQKKGAEESAILLKHLKNMIRTGVQSNALIDIMQNGRVK